MKKIIVYILTFFLVFPGTTFAYSNAPHGWGIVPAKNETPPDAGEQLNKLLSNTGSV